MVILVVCMGEIDNVDVCCCFCCGLVCCGECLDELVCVLLMGEFGIVWVDVVWIVGVSGYEVFVGDIVIVVK